MLRTKSKEERKKERKKERRRKNLLGFFGHGSFKTNARKKKKDQVKEENKNKAVCSNTTVFSSSFVLLLNYYTVCLFGLRQSRDIYPDLKATDVTFSALKPLPL